MRRRLISLPLALLSVALLAPWGSAQGAVVPRVEEAYARPASGVLRVTGAGFGHGFGLSQYGAEGAARRGATLQQVLDHYYPGTQSLVTGNPQVRVQLEGMYNRPLVVSRASGLVATDEVNRTTLRLPYAKSAFWRARRVSDGTYRLQYLSAGRWISQAIGGRTVLRGPVSFAGPPVLRMWIATHSRTTFDTTASRGHRGRLRILNVPGGSAVVAQVAMETYLRGVVPHEAITSWPAIALQAQSVAARSYSTWKVDTYARTRWFDVYDSIKDQVYLGAVDHPAPSTLRPARSLEHPATDAAITATSRLVRTWGGRAILAQFGSSNGGHSGKGGAPYLAARPDPWEAYSSNPLKSWTGSVSMATLERLAGKPAGWVTRVVVSSRDGFGSWGGRVLQVRLDNVAPDGRVTSAVVTGEQIRRAAALRSNYFTFSP